MAGDPSYQVGVPGYTGNDPNSQLVPILMAFEATDGISAVAIDPNPHPGTTTVDYTSSLPPDKAKSLGKRVASWPFVYRHWSKWPFVLGGVCLLSIVILVTKR